MTNADESPSLYVMCVIEIEKLIIPFGSTSQPAEFVFPPKTLGPQDRHAVICSFLFGAPRLYAAGAKGFRECCW
jgi:hypothetical protein